MALAAAKDLPQLSLVDALELTVLIARKDPRRHQRVAARWLLRYLEEHPAAAIEEAALAASSPMARSPAPATRKRPRPCGPWPQRRLASDENEVQQLAPEPCPAPNTEPSLQGPVFFSILPRCPEKRATDKNGG